MKINVVYTLNNSFVPQVAASIESILCNKEIADEIEVYLIGENISDKNMGKLNHQVNKFQQKVHFIPLQQLSTLIGFEFDTGGWNQIVLARLFLDKLLPEDVEKVIYLDGDTIIRGSLRKLWETDLSEAVIAMAPEPTVNKKRKNFLGLNTEPYCNAGILLINLNLWKNESYEKKILDYYKKNNGKLFANDQDALNAVLKDSRIILSPTYNYFNVYDQYSYSYLKKLIYPAKFISKEEFLKVKQNPTIIHYLGEERPWRVGNKHRFKKDFENSLYSSGWSDMKFEKGWELYFKFFYLFNGLTRPFPMIRYHIMNILIPYFIRFRAKGL